MLSRDEYIDYIDIGEKEINKNIADSIDCKFEAGTVTLSEVVEKVEKEMIIDALEKSGGIQTKAAELLGISERNLRYKIQKYGIKK